MEKKKLQVTVIVTEKIKSNSDSDRKKKKITVIVMENKIKSNSKSNRNLVTGPISGYQYTYSIF